MNETEKLASKVRQTISAPRYDGYKGHDPVERKGYLTALVDVEDALFRSYHNDHEGAVLK